MRTNEEVLAANYVLSRTIQMLRDENKQMQVSSAEIQAATEEVETLNEELQATIEELNTTNDDLEARSLELQAMALSAENARSQLRAILDAVDDGIVVVDEHQSVVLRSSSLSALAGDTDRPPEFFDSTGNPLDGETSPLARLAIGESFTTTIQLRSMTGERRPYEVVARPAGVTDGTRLGVLIVSLLPDGQRDA